MFDLESRAKKLAKEGKAYSPNNLGVISTWIQPRQNQEYNVYQLTDEGYIKNSIASACIVMIATSAPEALLKVYQLTPQGDVEIHDHWFTQLIKRPNPQISEFELWELTHTFLNTSGNAYWLLERQGNQRTGPVGQIQVLRSDQMVPVADAGGKIQYYQYHDGGKPYRFEPHQIMHFMFPNPVCQYEGLPPLARVLRELGIDNAATDFTKTFFENAAVPYGLLTTEQRLRDEEEVERIQNRWIKWFRGFRGKNRFKPAVLGQGMNYEQLALNFQEMEFEAIRSMTETRICGAFGVDPVLLPSWVGIKYGGKYSNYSEARKHLWDETIIPALRRIESKITSQLLINEGLVAKFDISVVQALQENVNNKFDRVRGAFVDGIMRLNEARTELGLESDFRYGDQYKFEIEGGDMGLKSIDGKGIKFVNQDEFINPRKL